MAIDRRTQNADVMERVLGLDPVETGDDVHTEVIDLPVQPSLDGCAVAAVQVTVGCPAPRRPKPKRPR